MNNFFKQFCVWILISAMALSVPSTAFAQVNHNDLAKDRTVIINKEPVTPAKLKEWKLGDVKTGEAFTAGKPKQLSRASTGTASFNGLNDVIPKTKDDDSEKPAGYVTITFKIVMGGGKISSKETTVYYVKPNTPVTLPTPKTEAYTGYVFDQWLFVGLKYSPNEPRSYTVDRDIKGRFKSLNHFYPSTDENGEPNAKPPGYVTVTFTDGENGKITSGKTVYYVNPKVKLKLEYLILASRNGKNRPIVTPDVGYKFESWLFGGSRVIDEDLIIPAIYTEEEAIIPERKDDGTENKKPIGYMTVTFKTTDKAGSVEKVVFINPNKAVKLEGYAPDVNPITGYDFAGWNRPLSEKVQYTEETVITAKFNEKDDVFPQEKTDGSDRPAGYLTVTFDKGEHGELSGKTVYYVNPNKEVTVPAPTVTPATDYVFDKWDQSLTQKFTAENTTITAEYSKRPFEPTIITDTFITTIGKPSTEEDYKNKIHVPGEDFKVTKILKEPDVSKSGTSVAEVQIEFANGVRKTVLVSVFVKPEPVIIETPVPGNCNNSCEQPNQPNIPDQPNKPNQSKVGKGALNTTDHYQYLIGYPDGNFTPNRGMTRAEVATMFTRLLRERPVKGQRYYTGFGDIHAGDWYANTVGYAVQVGIVSGYPDGSFKPNKPITRAEFAAIASRFDALAQGNDIAFSDLAPSHWGYNAIRSAASKGWITGYPDNTFRPEQAITRAEVTSITNRMLNRYADLYWIDAHRAEVIRFGDVKRSDWYFEPIMEATMGHDFIRDRDMKTEHWSGLNGKSFIEAR